MVFFPMVTQFLLDHHHLTSMHGDPGGAPPGPGLGGGRDRGRGGSN